MIKAIIVDDEPHFRENLRTIMNLQATDIEIVAEAGSVAEAVRLVTQHKPQLLFLDVHLPDGLGFDILKQLGSSNYKVIFTTAHDNYAITAFRFNAIDYLLKPVDPEMLIEALSRVREQPLLNSGLDERLQDVLSKPSERTKISLPTLEGITMLNIQDIIRCESDGSYTSFFTTKGRRIVVSRSIKEYDELLSPYRFFRVHQSHLVNLQYVEQFLKVDGGTLIMSDGSQIEVSRRRKDQLLQLIQSL
ncbi:MAG: LytR/AlgR family response regulator transcription factor [Bacteroidales bacterium]